MTTVRGPRRSRPWFRGAASPLAASAVVAAALLWWRGPDWDSVYHAFDFVIWRWIVLAVLINFVSRCSARALVAADVGQALPPEPQPQLATCSRRSASACSRTPSSRAGGRARARGDVSAATCPMHPAARARPSSARCSHIVSSIWCPVTILVVWVLAHGEDAALGGRRDHDRRPRRLRAVRGRMARRAPSPATARERGHGLAAPAPRHGPPGPLRAEGARPAAAAILLQPIGWLLQLLAVYDGDAGVRHRRTAAGGRSRARAHEHRDVFPLWPGNVGLLQAAVALPLRDYGVPYATGFAFGLVLQAVEMSVGVGLGLIVPRPRGLSFAMLRRMRGGRGVLRGRGRGGARDGRGARGARGAP